MNKGFRRISSLLKKIQIFEQWLNGLPKTAQLRKSVQYPQMLRTVKLNTDPTNIYRFPHVALVRFGPIVLRFTTDAPILFERLFENGQRDVVCFLRDPATFLLLEKVLLTAPN